MYKAGTGIVVYIWSVQSWPAKRMPILDESNTYREVQRGYNHRDDAIPLMFHIVHDNTPTATPKPDRSTTPKQDRPITVHTPAVYGGVQQPYSSAVSKPALSASTGSRAIVDSFSELKSLLLQAHRVAMNTEQLVTQELAARSTASGTGLTSEQVQSLIDATLNARHLDESQELSFPPAPGPSDISSDEQVDVPMVSSDSDSDE